MIEKRLSDAVFSIAWGYILIHLHFNIGPFDILPDWLGYIFFFNAISVLQREEPTAKLLKPLAVVLALWSIVVMFTGEMQIVSIIVTVISLYFHFQFLTNLANIGAKYMCTEAEQLRVLRTVRTILITIFALPIPWDELGILAYALIVGNIIVAIWICKVLFSFRKSLQIMENMRTE